jgi:hypothetical protein
MLLAVFAYRPIYQQLLKITDTTNSITDAAAARIESVINPVEGKDYSLQTTTTLQFYQNGITERTVHQDTLYVNGTERAGTGDKVSKELPERSYWAVVALVFIQIVFVTMVYGPIAAFLVEIFPTKIRYTSMSLPYHLGNGVFGGMTPFIAVLLGTLYTGDVLVGLWYPIAVAAVCLVIGVIYLKNRIDPDVND